MENKKPCSHSRVIKTALVLPPDTNAYGTLFGGKLMSYIDDVAAIAGMRHSRYQCVTASTDSVDFLNPIHQGDAVCLEAFVTYTGRTSMEVFIKIISENLVTGKKNVCAMSFLTMVAVDEYGRPVNIPQVYPETEEEKKLYETGKERAELRKKRRKESKIRAEELLNTISTQLTE